VVIYVVERSFETIECLKKYNWPGNIRELENVIERAINLLDTDLVIKPKHLPQRFLEYTKKDYINNKRTLKETIEDIEKQIILECLEKTEGNKNKSAKILGLSRTGLYKKIDRYGIDI